jgi:hypothetical protein
MSEQDRPEAESDEVEAHKHRHRDDPGRSSTFANEESGSESSDDFELHRGNTFANKDADSEDDSDDFEAHKKHPL